MPNVCGPFTLSQAPEVCGSWSVAPAVGPDGRKARLSQLVLPVGSNEAGLAGVVASFQRLVDATVGAEGPASLLPLLAGGLENGALWIAEADPGVPSLYDTVSSSGPIPPEKVQGLLHAAAAALEPLHSSGLFHGWLSPRNVFQEQNAIRLGGWVWPSVFARLAAVVPAFTWPDPEYLAPETLQGAAPNGQVETYSGAMLAVFAATGGVDAVVNRLMLLPPALGQAVGAGLASSSPERYAGIKEMVVDATVEQAIAMPDLAETNAVPTGGDVPDWARDLLEETTARRDAGRPLVDLPEVEAARPPEAAPPPPAPGFQSVPPPTEPEPIPMYAATVHVEPSEPAPVRANATPVFEWNVGEHQKRSMLPYILGALSALFVILGLAVTLIRDR